MILILLKSKKGVIYQNEILTDFLEFVKSESTESIIAVKFYEHCIRIYSIHHSKNRQIYKLNLFKIKHICSNISYYLNIIHTFTALSRNSYLDLHFGCYRGRQFEFDHFCYAVARWCLYALKFQRVCDRRYYKPFSKKPTSVISRLFYLLKSLLFIPINPPIHTLNIFSHIPCRTWKSYREFVLNYNIKTYKGLRSKHGNKIEVIYLDNGLYYLHDDVKSITTLSEDELYELASAYYLRIRVTLLAISDFLSQPIKIIGHPRGLKAKSLYTDFEFVKGNTRDYIERASIVLHSYTSLSYEMEIAEINSVLLRDKILEYNVHIARDMGNSFQLREKKYIWTNVTDVREISL